MEAITIDILLEFLYKKFAVTFILCLVGSFIREVSITTKGKTSKMLSIKKIVTSTVFSTFLMCACSEYVDLPFSVYAIINVLCGMWGLAIVDLLITDNFLLKFLRKLIKKIASPLLKIFVESVAEVAEEKQKEKENSKKKSKKKKNKEELTDNEE